MYVCMCVRVLNLQTPLWSPACGCGSTPTLCVLASCLAALHWSLRRTLLTTGSWTPSVAPSREMGHCCRRSQTLPTCWCSEAVPLLLSLLSFSSAYFHSVTQCTTKSWPGTAAWMCEAFGLCGGSQPPLTTARSWLHDLRPASGLSPCLYRPAASRSPAHQPRPDAKEGPPWPRWDRFLVWWTSPAPPLWKPKRFLLLQECLAPRPGCWPRPPVNYYILIALALMSNHNSGLKVQQIYHFTRSGVSRGGKIL